MNHLLQRRHLCCEAAGEEAPDFLTCLACEICQWFNSDWKTATFDLQGTLQSLQVHCYVVCCSVSDRGCPLCLIRTPHWPFLLSFLICPPLICPLPCIASISQSICLHVFRYCIPPPPSVSTLVFSLFMSVFISISLSCHVYFPPIFSFSSPPISLCRCSSQQSRLLQNPAAAQHSEETKATAVARVLCWRFWGAFGW